ncbi:MAG: ABC transporter ATP-binding protein [Defluviitaleaceae bacterium]|nr:ABC transporter ATP-binding protein [Defluviitaleaceae bacterium]
MVVKINNLVKRYKEVLAVDHFNMEISQGEVLGLLGPNGSGKTTTINCMLSLLKYDKGEISVFGKPMHPGRYDAKREIGMVMQSVAVFDDLTVYENIDYFCGLYIKDRNQRKKCIDEVIEFVSLQDQIKFLPPKLSGGLLRRLHIACGIAHKPKLIVFDEPTVAVDPQSRNHILDGIMELNRQGATIVYTSHYMEEVEQICSRIIIMDNGKKIAEGTKEELKRMIKTGETIKVDVLNLDKNHLEDIKALPNVFAVDHENETLTIRLTQGKNNLMRILEYFSTNNITHGQVLSELPTLNDVFLEITGKTLRD